MVQRHGLLFAVLPPLRDKFRQYCRLRINIDAQSSLADLLIDLGPSRKRDALTKERLPDEPRALGLKSSPGRSPLLAPQNFKCNRVVKRTATVPVSEFQEAKAKSTQLLPFRVISQLFSYRFVSEFIAEFGY
jgi:hypothetical protein